MKKINVPMTLEQLQFVIRRIHEDNQFRKQLEEINKQYTEK